MSTDIPQLPAKPVSSLREQFEDFSPVETEELITATGVGVLPEDLHRVANLAERHSKLIPIVQIATPKKDSMQTFNKKAAREIADSIRTKGLIYPIILRPRSQVDGNNIYEVVAGIHRLYACHDILQWNEIPAVVVPLDDDDTKMFRLIENCARKTLKPQQLYEHVAAWRKLHAAKIGAVDPLDLRKGRKEAAARAREAKKIPADETSGELAATGSEPARSTQANLQEVIAHATGTSVSSAKRTMRVATMIDNLTDEEKGVVFPEDESKHPDRTQLIELADLTSKSISDTIKLVASGMGWSTALPLGSKRPGRKPDPEKPPSIDDLSDDEWLETTCANRLDQLKKKANFKSDALLYRRFVKLRKKIQHEIEDLLRATKDAGHRGPFHLMLERAFRIRFPSEWLICGMCGGTGKSKINGDSGETPHCNQCSGCGYKVQCEAL